jgi:hypothetical protein
VTFSFKNIQTWANPWNASVCFPSYTGAIFWTFRADPESQSYRYWQNKPLIAIRLLHFCSTGRVLQCHDMADALKPIGVRIQYFYTIRIAWNYSTWPNRSPLFALVPTRLFQKISNSKSFSQNPSISKWVYLSKWQKIIWKFQCKLKVKSFMYNFFPFKKLY